MVFASLSRQRVLGWNGLVLAVASIVPLIFALSILGVDLFKIFPLVPALMLLAFSGGILLLILRKPWTALVAGIPTFLLGDLLKFVRPGEISFLLHPATGGAKYIFDIFALWAGLVGLVSGIITYRALRRGTESSPDRRWAVVALAALLVVVGYDGAVIVAQAQPPTLGTVMGFTPDASLALTQHDNLFNLTLVAAKAGQLIELRVTNKDPVLHSFTTTDAPLADVDTPPGTTTTILLRAPTSSGDWHFHCKYHPGMEGIVKVA